NHFNLGVSVYDGQNVTVRATNARLFICPSDFLTNSRTPSGIALSSYAACHNGFEAPIDVKNDGAFILNRALRYEDIPDGSSNTVFVGEKLNDAKGEGWASGTRATLRNAGTLINGTPGGGPTFANPFPDEDAAKPTNATPTAAPGTPAYVGGFG